MAKITIRKQTRQAEYYVEMLGNNVELAMVKIPAGRFIMGSTEDELERLDRESPQHEVTVSEFFMGRYPITQGQWKAVVETTEKIERDLKPDPSEFKDAYENYDRWSRPVEQVSWLDAKEFCARLSQKTGRDYRLPTEAQWEYACRAGTATPFHFGETITTDLANYCGTDREIGGETYSGSYGRGPKGEYREQTTPVGYFKVANPFGLCDMHGNVWEWCEDDFHDNYEGAPDDGSAWLSQNTKTTDTTGYSKILRGGSWLYYSRHCRSAYRSINNSGIDYRYFGFRVVRVK
ncbi:formylglycine-generating sulfatase enzyme family protein [Lyngbya aestuarii BL J]|uniref:Formylglycine-generating sulfatase enzyme family protein n=1 Tax=Lyngbya aestuarii BL J TaxID=1348334 RepID=U7QL89_9CYAN|nr:formylglycine-generating enzyme family protein [Lyngbya aestuarii]ERT08643.1 formylglycine-generating sulfatase enzyme family protein [Lyngbya aestuarii BL J]